MPIGLGTLIGGAFLPQIIDIFGGGGNRRPPARPTDPFVSGQIRTTQGVNWNTVLIGGIIVVGLIFAVIFATRK